MFMVLGAGIYQLPLIERVRARGLRALVLSQPGPYPGITIADKFLPVNTTDAAAIHEIAQRERICGIATTGTDVCMPALGAVAESLGLVGPGAECARIASNKLFMKQAFKRHGVPSAHFHVVTDHAHAGEALANLGGRAMLKVIDSSGSRGVVRIDSPADLPAAWQQCRSVTHQGEILVEALLEGEEFGAQAIVRNGEVDAVILHGDLLGGPQGNVPIGHWLPYDLAPSVRDSSIDAVDRAVAAIGMRDGVANVDLMRVEDRVFVLEIGARMGATCLPENLSAFTGVDLYDHVVEVALGTAQTFRTSPEEMPTASVLLQALATGRLSRVDLPVEELQSEAVYEWCVDKMLGDYVCRFASGPDRIGHVVTVGQTANTALQSATRLVDSFRFSVAPDIDGFSDWVREPIRHPTVVLRGGRSLHTARFPTT